jgi:hypothetical protein
MPTKELCAVLTRISFVKLDLDGSAVPVLGVLDQKDHQER